MESRRALLDGHVVWGSASELPLDRVVARHGHAGLATGSHEVVVAHLDCGRGPPGDARERRRQGQRGNGKKHPAHTRPAFGGVHFVRPGPQTARAHPAGTTGPGGGWTQGGHKVAGPMRAPAKFAPASLALLRSVPFSSAPLSFAAARSARRKSAPRRSQLLRSRPWRSWPWKLAPSSAPFTRVPVRSAPRRSAPLSRAPRRL